MAQSDEADDSYGADSSISAIISIHRIFGISETFTVWMQVLWI